jgi:hypothetical protein
LIKRGVIREVGTCATDHSKYYEDNL